MNTQGTEKELRQRKVLLLLPVIMIPMLALAFHALGGGKGGAAKLAGPVGKGLNMALPDPRFDKKKKGLDKMGAYQLADQDSAKLAERRKLDPFSRVGLDTGLRKGWVLGRSIPDTSWKRALVASSGGISRGMSATDVQAGELMGKLDRLKEVLRRQEEDRSREGLPGMNAPLTGRSVNREPVSLSEREPVPVQPPGLRGPVPVMGGDPDLDKLNVMLDKVLRIQHPGAVTGDTTPVRRQGADVKALVPVPVDGWVPDSGQVLGHIPDPGGRDGFVEDGLGSGFSDVLEESGADSVVDNTVAAVIARDQTLVSGATVEMRLEQDALIAGRLIPRGSPVWGKAALSGERLSISVSTIRVGGGIIPVSLEVYDLDGMAGVREEGSITRDAVKASADDAIGTVGVTTLDPSVAGQATAAGIEAARSLLSRKVRLVRVSLKAGYRVLLRNKKL